MRKTESWMKHNIKAIRNIFGAYFVYFSLYFIFIFHYFSLSFAIIAGRLWTLIRSHFDKALDYECFPQLYQEVLWDSHPGLLTIYHSILGSSIEYGGQFFTWNTKSPDLIKLLRIQYQSHQKRYGISHLHSYHHEAKIPPLHLKFNLVVSRYIYKSMAYKFSSFYSALIQMELIASRTNRKINAIQNSNLFKTHTSQADTQKNSFTAHLIRQYSGMIWKFYPILTPCLVVTRKTHKDLLLPNSSISLLITNKRSHFLYGWFQGTILSATKDHIPINLFWIPSHSGIP